MTATSKTAKTRHALGRKASHEPKFGLARPKIEGKPMKPISRELAASIAVQAQANSSFPRSAVCKEMLAEAEALEPKRHRRGSKAWQADVDAKARAFEAKRLAQAAAAQFEAKRKVEEARARSRRKMVDAVREFRYDLLDQYMKEEFSIDTKTEWNLFAGSYGGIVTRRVDDGKKLTSTEKAGCKAWLEGFEKALTYIEQGAYLVKG